MTGPDRGEQRPTMNLEGQVALISGSAVGVGRGLALTLSAAGARIVGLDIDEPANLEAAALVRERGGEFLPIRCDVSDRFQVREAVDRAVEHWGQIDLLMNNAAVFEDSTLLGGSYDTQTEAYERSMGSCALGAFFCTCACTPIMIEGGGGTIINIMTEHLDEDYALTRLPGLGYDCAKFALWRQVETWAYQLRDTPVRVYGLAFGATDTPMLRGFAPDRAAVAMKPEDIGQAVLNVLAHGAEGPSGHTWRFGYTGTPRAESLKAIAAIAPASDR